MPLLVHAKCFKSFKTAAREVMRWKRWGQKRANAYVGSFFRKQEKSQTIWKRCGGKRNGAKPRSLRATPKPKTSPRTVRRGAGRGGRDALKLIYRGRRNHPKWFRNVTIYKTRPKGYRWKVTCGGKLVTYVKRKPFAQDIRDTLATGRKGCRVVKA